MTINNGKSATGPHASGAPKRSGALADIRVLDMSRVLAGPWATQVLADLGADVIKIERPGSGDETRGWGPPWIPDAAGNPSAVSAYYVCANRNKRSVTVNIAHPQGQDLLRRLAAQSDVLVENFKTGALARYGLDYGPLHKVNPRLVYCSITGFGQTGPYATRAGYDFLVQGLGGLMSVTGRPDAEPGGGPVKVGVALTDILTGLYAANAIQAALAAREHTGKGQYIDMALLDVQVACLANQAMNYLATGRSPTRMGNAHPNIVPYQAFPTADGHMILAVGNDGQFRHLCEEIQRPDLADDARYATNQARVENRAILTPILASITKTRSTAQWVSALEARSVPCGPVNTIEEVFKDPQVQARELRIDLPRHDIGTIPMVGNPIHLSDTPVDYRLPPPALGEHTDAVLKDVLGLDAPDVEALRANGIV